MSFTDTFNNDYDNTLNDLNTFKNELGQIKKSVEAYQDAKARALSIKDPILAMIWMGIAIADKGAAQLAMTAATDEGALKLQGDLSKLSSDLESMSSQSDDYTPGKAGTTTGKAGTTSVSDTPPKSDPSKYLQPFTKHLDKMLDLLKPGSETGDLLETAMGSAATSSLNTQYGTLRGMIYWSGDANSPYSPKSLDSQGVYFDADSDAPVWDPNDSSEDPSKYKITSFGELQNDQTLQGNPEDATTVQKKKDGAFNTNTATTQSTNSASEQIISTVMTQIKTVTAFASDIFHETNSQESAAVKATARG